MVDHGRVVGNATRAVIVSNRRITGLSADVIAELVSELGPLWHERHQAKLTSRPRRRAVGAGAKHRFVFVDRLLATLVHLRHGATHDVLACWFGVDRSTITRAIGEMRPLLAERGCTISPGVRLRTLAEVIDHLGTSGQTGIIDGTEIRVRRPAAGRKDRDVFISGKNKQNAVKTMVLTDQNGRDALQQPSQTRQLRGHHSRPPVRAGQAPGRRARRRDPCRCRLPGARRPDRRTRGDATAPEVQARRCTSDSARHTPHAASGSSTASPT
ncbi:transposase family protein [Streptomyces anulatus]|uniref:transposase n=1 Tax=Streptomyces TaxID=1883 RepID=UPI000A7805E1|nr:transposase [Streptomyces sp. TSRI0395]